MMKNESSRRFIAAAVIMVSSIISLLCSNIPLSIVWLGLALLELIWGMAALKKEKQDKQEEQK